MSIHHNPDAGAWAAFFVKTWREVHPDQPVPDEGWMLGWFANAMMAMFDAGPQVAEIARLTADLAAARAEVETLRKAVHTARSRAESAVQHSVERANATATATRERDEARAALRDLVDALDDGETPIMELLHARRALAASTGEAK